MPSWAETTDVLALTGVVVTELTRTLAASAVELVTGLIEGVEREDIADRDLYWLKLAVCYQAAWLNAQPDYLERNAIKTSAQDGDSVVGGNPDWLVLSPLARKALKRLSWRGMRDIVVTRAGLIGRLNTLSETYDDSLRWVPL